MGGSQGGGSQRPPAGWQATVAAASSAPLILPPVSDPVELADPTMWSKTRLVAAVPGWARGHAREVKHLAAWADALFDDPA